jgi:hypothetical protein
MEKNKIIKVSTIIGLSIIMMGCNKNKDDQTVQQQLASKTPLEILEDYPVDSLYGKTYQDGLIFYVNENDGSGMVVDTEDLSQTAYWGCTGTTIDGADSSGVGYGKANTDDILSGCADANSAAGLCYYSSASGSTDWFLPSTEELELIYNRIHLAGLGDFPTNDYYWTSTEDTGFNTAMHVSFADGSANFSTKSNAHRVRAVRSF